MKLTKLSPGQMEAPSSALQRFALVCTSFAAYPRCSTGTINMNKGEENRDRRNQLRDQYRVAYDGLNGILFTEDPVGINFGENTDEYEPEVGTILPRLMSCTSVGDVKDVVSQEFTRWFSGSIVGPTDGYARIAQRIWDEVLPTLEPRSCGQTRVP